MYQAYHLGDLKIAEDLVVEYLNLYESIKTNWNYGNAIHHSNLVIGRIALKKGKLNDAKKFLLKAGKTPGSPKLNSIDLKH